MKVVKKLVKGIALCAALVAIGSFVACSNASSSDSNAGSGTTPDSGTAQGGGTTTEEGLPAGAAALGLSGMDGWGVYTISDKADDKVTVSHTTAPEQYKCCGADITFGTANKVTFTVTNNADAEAWIQIHIKKDSGDAAISSATIGGTACDDVTWGASTTIPAKGSKDFVLNIDNTKGADKFVVSLNSNKDTSENPATGNITISKAYIYGK